MLGILKSRKAKIVILAVIVLGIAGGRYFLTYAQQFIDSFTDTSRVANTWNVTVDTGAGAVKLAARACDDTTWFCSAATTCGNTLGDGTYVIVKRTNETSRQWKTANTNCDKPECGQDGGQNGDNLVADNTVNFTNYPARDACKLAGGRLPTLTELQCIYANRVTFGNNFGTSFYWSATEDSAAFAVVVNFGGGSAGTSSKSVTNSVRCVRGW